MKITQQMADQAALIVQAFEEGREVLERQVGLVRATEPIGGSIALGDPHFTYELAPKEPAVCWRNEYANPGGGARFGDTFTIRSVAVDAGRGCKDYLRTVKFVEASE